MIDLSYVSIGARCEDRVSGTADFLARRGQYANVSGIRYEFRVSVGGRVPLLFTRARRRAIAYSAYVVCRGVGASRVLVGVYCCLNNVFGVDDV